MNKEYYAHSKEGKPPSEWQPLEDHLKNVAELAKNHAKKIGMGNYGELLGLPHDLGKYSAGFQRYISAAMKRNDPEFNPDEDEDFKDVAGKKGKIDQSTAGAQYLTQYLTNRITSSNMTMTRKSHTDLCFTVSIIPTKLEETSCMPGFGTPCWKKVFCFLIGRMNASIKNWSGR
jgi:hypothetical protein